MADTTSILDWSHDLDEVPPAGLDIARQATAEERQRLAARLDILACNALEVTYRLRLVTAGRYLLTGTLDARIEQACVVTLEPVPEMIAEAMDVEFWPDEDLPDTIDGEIDVTADDEPEPIIDGRIDIGRVVYEIFAGAINPWPRSEDAALERHVAGSSLAGEHAGGPFASLAQLKKKD